MVSTHTKRVLTRNEGESMELSDRKKKILTAVIERYIQTGEPVGSKVLCEGLSVSSATVRNEMSELSEIGYLEQPHTSAGRIPSQKGIRYYINNLMPMYDISNADRFSVQSRFDNFDGEPKDILADAAKILSEITGCTAVALTPYDINAFIKKVEMVPLGSRTVLIIIMMSTGVIKSKICRCDGELDIKSAELFYNIAAAYFIGRSSDDFNVAAIQSLAVSLGDKALMMTPLLVTLTDLAKEASMCNIIIEGQSKLLGCKELESDVYNMFEQFKNSACIAGLINKGNEKTNILVGRESMNRAFENASIICSKYSVGGRYVGSVGVIGPVRIDYSRVIPSIINISDIVGNVLSELIEE